VAGGEEVVEGKPKQTDPMGKVAEGFKTIILITDVITLLLINSRSKKKSKQQVARESERSTT
jgi:hypothetical protein